MRRIISFILVLVMSVQAQALNMQEMYVRTGGANNNAGSSNNDSADFTYTSGNWVQSTRVFTLTSGTTSGVTDGMMASVFTDGATSTAYIAYITGHTGSTVTLASGGNGTVPSDGTGNKTMKIGGAWQTAKFAFEFPVVSSASTGGVYPLGGGSSQWRINFAAGTYSNSAAIQPAGNKQIYFKGAGIGSTIIDGGTGGASYNLLTFTSSGGAEVSDMTFYRNGGTGSGTGITLSATRQALRNVRVTGMAGLGIEATTVAIINHTEIDHNNTDNNSGLGGLKLTSTTVSGYENTIHDNTGTNSSGVLVASGVVSLSKSIIANNGAQGISITGSGGNVNLIECDVFANGSAGFNYTSSTGGAVAYLVNCNFEANGTYGVAMPTGSSAKAILTEQNCRFYNNTTNPSDSGWDAMANVSGRVTGAATGYTAAATSGNPRTGNFAPATTDRKFTGFTLFNQNSSDFNSTTSGTPDIGAVQHQASGGAPALSPGAFAP